jgi:predicted nucleic acid-binding protein
VTLLYADTSALATAYLTDESEHDVFRSVVLEADDPVVTSELAGLELTAAMTAAQRAGRIADARRVLRRVDADFSGDPVSLLTLVVERVFPTTRRLLYAYPLYAADAVHLAVALVDAPQFAPGGDVLFVTRDERQADAARAEGLSVWKPRTL